MLQPGVQPCSTSLPILWGFPNVRADLLVKIVGADPTMRCDQPGARCGLALGKCCVETPGIYNAGILPTVLSKSGKGRHVHMCACSMSIPRLPREYIANVWLPYTNI